QQCSPVPEPCWRTAQVDFHPIWHDHGNGAHSTALHAAADLWRDEGNIALLYACRALSWGRTFLFVHPRLFSAHPARNWCRLSAHLYPVSRLLYHSSVGRRSG